MSPHPTPWRVQPPERDSRAPDVVDANGAKVHHGQWGGWDVARIIAAAPDLLQALGHLRDLVVTLAPDAHESSLVGQSLAAADAAILKALGEAELERRERLRTCREYSSTTSGGRTND